MSFLLAHPQEPVFPVGKIANPPLLDSTVKEHAKCACLVVGVEEVELPQNETVS